MQYPIKTNFEALRQTFQSPSTNISKRFSKHCQALQITFHSLTNILSPICLMQVVSVFFLNKTQVNKTEDIIFLKLYLYLFVLLFIGNRQ